VVLVALASLAGCAPTTMSPMVMRLGPGNPRDNFFQAGLRAGPRLSAPIAARSSSDDSDNFAGNHSSFSTRQWSMAYDLSLTQPLSEKLSLHVGGQGEIYYPLPLPGYGLYAGLSSWYGTQSFGVAPAIVVRGATDFGINTRGGPGSIVGVETSASFYLSPEKRVAVGLVPFLGVHEVFSHGEQRATLYYGGTMVMQLPLGSTDALEFSGGFGRVKQSGGVSWNTPLFGARWGQ
jgi:hypothetical protein